MMRDLTEPDFLYINGGTSVKKVFIDIHRCTGCKSCEIACCVEHSASKDLFRAISEVPRPQKRIYVESSSSFSLPVKCMHCDYTACILVCPTGAMFKDAQTGTVLVNTERCMGCLMCAMVCPFGAITSDKKRNVALKCDFCITRLKEGRDPACVEACPTDALSCGEPEHMAKIKRSNLTKKVITSVDGEKKAAHSETLLDKMRRTGGI
jgi:carbon-monoxide dehydrogenase iron sulfur subunit